MKATLLGYVVVGVEGSGWQSFLFVVAEPECRAFAWAADSALRRLIGLRDGFRCVSHLGIELLDADKGLLTALFAGDILLDVRLVREAVKCLDLLVFLLTLGFAIRLGFGLNRLNTHNLH